MRTVNVHDAKTHLSALLNDVEAGEQIVIAKAGKPVAKLSRYEGPVARPIGIDDGRGWIADDFDSALPPQLEPYS
jgi:prevent-host-death family protein